MPQKNRRKRHPLATPDRFSLTRQRASRREIGIYTPVKVYDSDYKYLCDGEYVAQVTRQPEKTQEITESVQLLGLPPGSEFSKTEYASTTKARITLFDEKRTVIHDDEIGKDGRLKYHWITNEPEIHEES